MRLASLQQYHHLRQRDFHNVSMALPIYFVHHKASDLIMSCMIAVAARCRWLSMSRILRFPVAAYSSPATSSVQPQTTVGHKPQDQVVLVAAVGFSPPAFHVCPNASTCNVSVVIRKMERPSPFLFALLDRTALL